MQHSSERAITSFGGSIVFLVCVFTEPCEVFTQHGESLQLVNSN